MERMPLRSARHFRPLRSIPEKVVAADSGYGAHCQRIGVGNACDRPQAVCRSAPDYRSAEGWSKAGLRALIISSYNQTHSDDPSIYVSLLAPPRRPSYRDP